jgi:SAM-dependent methyltransferase
MMIGLDAQHVRSEVRTKKEFPVQLDLAKAFDWRSARERRYNMICELVGLRPGDRVLDVGCGAGRSFEEFNRDNEIVGLDLDPSPKIFQDNFRFVPGDAASMEVFKDGEFDVVVSVGVLERVVPFENLRRAAKEIQRVGKAYIVVVPHMFTFIEPHSQLPFGQFTPRNFRRFAKRWDLLRNVDQRRPSVVEEERLFYLRAHEWKSLFPESKLLSYSFLPVSLIRNYFLYRQRSAQTST